MPPHTVEEPSIPRPVWFLGWTSLFTDAATEMIYPLLPVYLSRVLGASAVSLGIIEGVAEAVNSVLKVISGYWSDRRSRRRPIVIAGYALSSISRPLIALTMTWPQVLLIRALDRTGKGIRGAPRDALLARFATPSTRGASSASTRQWITSAPSSVQRSQRWSSSSSPKATGWCSG